MKELYVPIIIGGEEIKNSSENYTFSYPNLEVHVPKLNNNLVSKLDNITCEEIHELKLNDIVAFFCEVAKLWKNPDYECRKLAEKYGPMITGQSPQMYFHNIGIMFSLISLKVYSQDIVDSELIMGKTIIDEWVPCHNAYIHAEPLGKLLHIVSGNVPVAGIYSIFRGALTKNANTIKISSKDLLTSLLFIKSFYDIDPNHPITKSTSAIYWGRNEENLINHFCAHSNGICIWGGKDTIGTYKPKAPAECEVIEYGPKTGMQLIIWDENSAPDLPLRVARDICVFDQEACLSPQIIYLQGDAESFISELSKGLEKYNVYWPKGDNSIDHYIHMNYTIQANAFFGNPSYKDEKLKWLIVNMKKDAHLSLEHPLGRTVYIYPLDDIKDGLRFVDSGVQTIGVEPKSLAYELKDELSKRGVRRIANVGCVDFPRPGIVHNSQYLSRLVRISGIEREMAYKYKTYDFPEDYVHPLLATSIKNEGDNANE